MEDEKIKSLFADFNPELSSDFQFFSRLQKNLDSVEFIKQQSEELRSRNKKAIAIAATAGFIVGFIFSLSLPYLYQAVMQWQLSLPDTSMLYPIANNFSIIAWLILGATSVFTALNTYEISLSLLSHHPTSTRK